MRLKWTDRYLEVEGREAMAISTGDILRVASRALWETASDIVNVWYMEVVDDASNSVAQILADVAEFIEDIYTPLGTAIPNNVSFADIAVSNVTNGETYGSVAYPTFTEGSGTVDAISPGLAPFIYASTDIPNVQFRKWFLPFTETELSDGVLSLATLIALGSCMSEAANGGAKSNGTDLACRIAHFIEDGEELATPEFYPITNVLIDERPGVRNSRRPGTGS